MSNKWTALAELRKGAIFETRRGRIRAVKSEYHYPYGGCECTLLASGEYAHFDQVTHSGEKHNATEVRELSVGAPVNDYEDGRPLCEACDERIDEGPDCLHSDEDSVYFHRACAKDPTGV